MFIIGYGIGIIRGEIPYIDYSVISAGKFNIAQLTFVCGLHFTFSLITILQIIFTILTTKFVDREEFG